VEITVWLEMRGVEDLVSCGKDHRPYGYISTPWFIAVLNGLRKTNLLTETTADA
jgi:hypothetical protein